MNWKHYKVSYDRIRRNRCDPCYMTIWASTKQEAVAHVFQYYRASGYIIEIKEVKEIEACKENLIDC